MRPVYISKSKEKEMTDQMDGTGAGNANTGAQGSGSSGVNSESETVEQLLKRIEVLEAHQKTQQSGKDRGINQLRKETEGQFAEISSYLAKFEDPADAERNYKIDQLLKGNVDGLGLPGAGSGSENDVLAGQNVADDQSANLLAGLGVDNQSAEFKKLVASGLSTEQAALQYLANKQASVGEAEGVASGVAGAGGTGGLTGTAQEALAQERLKELDAQPHWSPYQLQKLNDKYAKLGLTGIE
jgi:hypothetical protein